MGTKSSNFVETIKGGLIVSCQAHGDHPLRDSRLLSALAQCAERGGAAAIRADGPEDIGRIKKDVSLPIVGIYKVPVAGKRFFITSSFEHAVQVVEAGADAVALEATYENRPDADELRDLIRKIREDLRVPVMADVSGVEEGLRASDMGADLVATTLSGYTSESPSLETPDFELVGTLAKEGIRTVAEGHVRTPEQVKKLFESGAHSVVVGTAITDPVSITSWFVEASSQHLKRNRSGGVEKP